MKSFMEEYGKVIVVAIIVVALITVALLFKTSGMESINGIWRNFMTKSQLGLEISDSETSGSGSEQGGSEESSTANLISFTVGGISFQAEEGMTWYELAGTDYHVNNNEGVYIQVTDADEVLLNYINGGGSSIKNVNSSDVIVSNASYELGRPFR